MKSPYTGGEVVRQVNEEEIEFRGETFVISYNNYKCVDSGKEFTNRKIDELNLHLLHSAYREKHNIPFPEEIKSIREKYDVNQTKMAEILGFGVNTYRNYENGSAIPVLSNARLISMAAKPAGFIDLVEKCDSLSKSQRERFIKSAKSCDPESPSLEKWLFKNSHPSEFTGFRKPEIEKLSAMIAYLASDSNSNVYKVKMNKLLFYSDFYHFKKTGYSISGISYQAIQMGPVPHRYGTLFEVGAEKGDYAMELVKMPDREAERFSAIIDCNALDVLAPEELMTLDKVKASLGPVKTSDLINMSHEEDAWLDNKDEKKLIAYHYAFRLKYPE